MGVLRRYIRQRDTLIKSASTQIQRMQKALTQMNVPLHRVMRAISGTTGLAIIRAIVAGERDLHQLAALQAFRLHASTDDLAAALQGDDRGELVFVLTQARQLYEVFQAQIAACDVQLEPCLSQFADQVALTTAPLPPSKRWGKQQPGNVPNCDWRTHLYRIRGVDFTQMEGVGMLTVLTRRSALGLDSSRFPSVKPFASWLGLCPGSRLTGGKRKSSQTRQVANRVATALRMAAQTLVRAHSALGAFYRRMPARMGAPKAMTATAPKLARLFYHLWTSGDAFVDPGMDAYEQQYQERVVKNLKKKALALGFDLRPQTTSPECVS